jgi:molybdopterin-guanine dinucleotide biosynthesis protein A
MADEHSHGPSCTGFAVAGGRSRRMGRDKALLPWGRTTLLAHTLARLGEITDDVRILCGDERRYEDIGVPVLVDSVPDAGPLGGVYTALEHLDRPAGLFLAVDLPHVPTALLRLLLANAEGHDAVVPVSRNGVEPLCAVYGRSCLQPIRDRLQRGDRKMTSFWPDVRVREVGEAELAALGDVALFHNVNTSEDYEQAKPPDRGE